MPATHELNTSFTWTDHTGPFRVVNDEQARLYDERGFFVLEDALAPEEVDALIKEEVSTLGSKAGGLMLIYGLYPGVPLENAKALMDAMEKYAFYYE